MGDQTRETPPAPAAPPAPEPAPERAKPPTYLAQGSKDFVKQHGERFAKYPEFQQLLEAHVSMEDRLERAIIVPDPKNPDPEEVKQLRVKLGIPEKSDDYGIQSGDLKGEGAEAMIKAIAEVAFSAGMNKTQAQKVFDFLASRAKIGREAQEKAAKEAEDKFDELMAAHFGGDKKRAQEARNLYKAGLIRDSKDFKDTDLIPRLKRQGLLYDPVFAAAFARREAYAGDHPFILGEGGAGPGGVEEKASGTQGTYHPDWERAHGKNRGRKRG